MTAPAKATLSTDEIRSSLREISWDFADAWTRHGLSLLHWYPTKLPPQVASSLIGALTQRGEIVCDPFCGSGTVLGEAVRLGRRAIGLDVNPVAYLISKAKTTLIPIPQLSQGFGTFMQRLHFGLGIVNSSHLPLPLSDIEEQVLQLIASAPRNTLKPEFSKWFHPVVYRELSFASQCIALEPDDIIKRLLTVVISSLLRTVSSQSRSWGYIADNTLPRTYVQKHFFATCARRLRATERGMQMFIEQCASQGVGISEANASTQVFCEDVRQMASIEDGAIDCIVTSPPYGNVSDNVMSQRLSMLWLDYDLTEVRNREIGARWKRFRKLSLQDYVAEMKDGLTQMKRVLAPKGRLALVIGSSPKWEKGYPTVPLIDSFISQDLCMEELGQFKRVVGPSRQHGSFGVIEEHILVYRKR